jgi:hypothetical protein
MCSLAWLMVVGLAAPGALARPAEASAILDVTYTGGTIDFGPLSFGLAELPDSVAATFHLGPGVEGSEPPIREYGLADVLSASLAFGDGTWGAIPPSSFFMRTINGVPTELVYGFNPITTATVSDGPILNFPLTISGTDIASGEAFQYTYATSTQTLSAVPEPATFFLVLVGAAGLGRMARRRR